MKRITWIALLWLFQLSTVGAASFDCSKAQSKVEHLICDNQDISRLDEDLNKAYSLAQGRSADKQTATKEQRRWLKEVRNACSDVNCLKVAYAGRISKLSNMVASQNTARMTAKHIMPKTKEMDEFESFVKDREYLDDPYEFASPEAEKLAKFIEKNNSDEVQLDSWRKKMLLENIYGAEYLKIGDDVYLVRIGFEIRIADLAKQQYQGLAFGYNLEISELGFLADGTGWVLAHYGGLTSGRLVEGFHLITFFDLEKPVYVTSSNVVGYARDYESECVNGKIIGHEWNDGQNELIFTVEEKDCQQVEKASIKRRLVFAVSKGKVHELR